MEKEQKLAILKRDLTERWGKIRKAKSCDEISIIICSTACNMCVLVTNCQACILYHRTKRGTYKDRSCGWYWLFVEAEEAGNTKSARFYASKIYNLIKKEIERLENG